MQDNSYGINLRNFLIVSVTSNIGPTQGSNNIVYNNNFVNNTKQNVKIENSYPYNSTGIANGTVVVSWDNGKVGNYWSDYNGGGSYVINQNNVDHHPIAQPVDIPTVV